MQQSDLVQPPETSTRPDRTGGLFCNRTLNIRGIRAIGYDMDYTLVHYHVRYWEERAYAFLKEGLMRDGWPIEDLTFDKSLVVRGLVIDTALGNVVKANRFGYVKAAFHGTRRLSYEEQREVYSRTYVDLKEPRWVFLNTFFSLSEGCMYMQLVDLLDSDVLSDPGDLGDNMNYADLYEAVRHALDTAHAEGRLKAEIVEDPEPFVYRDPDVPRTLLDQKEAGKTLLLITNSEWAYTSPMLTYCFDPYLPGEMTWRDLFDYAIVGARKPTFFTERMPAFEVVSEEGLLREHYGVLEPGKVYVGGNAALVEASLGYKGEDILYVGDHLFTDVNISKNVHRWRTGLVLREMEEELEAIEAFAPSQQRLTDMMQEKVELEHTFSTLRLSLQRMQNGSNGESRETAGELEKEMAALREQLVALDRQIAPLARESATLLNPNWGPLMRTGSDKSLLARQVENYADVYTARVSSFLEATPFAYLRSHRGSLPHDLI